MRRPVHVPRSLASALLAALLATLPLTGCAAPKGGSADGEGRGRMGPARCDPSYPDVCIPPPPPDLDCRDIPYRRFRVLPPDPHRFDRDRDGIGCER